MRGHVAGDELPLLVSGEVPAQESDNLFALTTLALLRSSKTPSDPDRHATTDRLSKTTAELMVNDIGLRSGLRIVSWDWVKVSAQSSKS